MPKPLHQTIIQVIIRILIGYCFAGSILDSVSNAITLISFNTALWGTIIILLAYLIMTLFFRNRKIKWVTKEGQKITILNLGKKLLWSALGILILLWTPFIVGLTKKEMEVPKIINEKPVFSISDNHFKILILPFNSECEYQGQKIDVGSVVYKRLEGMNIQDSLNIAVWYLSNFSEFSNLTTLKADSIMNYHNANLILYGSYSLKQCEENGLNKICFNIRTDSTELNVLKIKTNSDYHMISFFGLESLRNGYGQESIDYIIYRLSGFASMKDKKCLRAIKLFEKIKDVEKYMEIREQIAFCNYILKNKKSIEYLNKLVKDFPNSDFSWWLLGNIYLFKSNQSKAEECLAKSLKINPKNILALNSFGWLFIDKNKPQYAEMYFLRGLMIDQNDISSLYNLGNLYRLKGEYLKSEQLLVKALKRDSTIDFVWNALGALYINTNKYLDAENCLNRALQLNPEDDFTLNNLGLLFSKRNNISKARSFYQQALKINPNNSTAWNNLGYTYLNEDTIKARTFFIKSLGINPNNEMAQGNIAFLFLKNQNYKEAAYFYNKSLKINPKNAPKWFNLGITYLELKKYDEAKNSFEISVTIDPNMISSWTTLGNINNFLKKDDEARICYEKALSIDSSNEAALNFLSDHFIKTKNHIKAKEILFKRLNLNPLNDTIWQKLGHVLNQMKAQPVRLPYYPYNDSLWLKMDQKLKETENFLDAEFCLNKALSINSKNTQAWMDLGYTYYYLHDFKKSKFCYEQVIKINPNNKQIKQYLEKLSSNK